MPVPTEHWGDFWRERERGRGIECDSLHHWDTNLMFSFFVVVVVVFLKKVLKLLCSFELIPFLQ